MARFSVELDRATSIALDTEADSLHHYGEKLCLMQLTAVGDGREDVLIDPLSSGGDLRPILEVLSRKTLLLHGADYDLRLLGLGFGFRAREVFDTMIASQYLGESSIGLAALLEKNFGVVLDKSMQKADWSRRPLPERMLVYAALDTHYLPDLVELLSDRLLALGRLEWHRQACARLASTRPEPRRIDSEIDWRIKGSRDLSPGEAAVLREIWGWREKESMQADLPPFRVASNESLILLAKSAVAVGAEEALSRYRSPLRGERRRTLEESLSLALALPESGWPVPAAKKSWYRPDAKCEARAARLKTIRDALAKELAIEPGIVAPRSALDAIAEIADPDETAIVELGGLLPWQAKLMLSASS